jgi:uncharacterized beta-barrel protein YwiB (DUF1934 family)
MTKDVIVSITGLQFDHSEAGDSEPVEVVTVGEYYLKNDKHYVTFYEVMEGFEGNTKNIVKISEDALEITKKGVTNVHMMFEKNKKNITSYNTPFGNLMIGILAKDINIKESEDSIEVHVDYTLDVNYEPLADCKITILLKSKNAKDFTLEH